MLDGTDPTAAHTLDMFRPLNEALDDNEQKIMELLNNEADQDTADDSRNHRQILFAPNDPPAQV